MYRCAGCDCPAQSPCADGCATKAHSDPWGWPESDRKLDIQSGLRVTNEGKPVMRAPSSGFAFQHLRQGVIRG